MGKPKRTINHHASAAIVESSGCRQKLFLFNKYDESYPRIFFRGALTLIGGSANFEKDLSPYENVEREINEEFSGRFEELKVEKSLVNILGERDAPQKKTASAPIADIHLVRDSILRSLIPYKDFLIGVPPLDGKPLFDYIASIYVSKIPENIFKLIENNLSKKRNLINEGYLQVADKKEVISGKLPFAWNVGATMGYYLNRPISNQMGISSKLIGKPRSSFEDYFDDFSYKIRG